MSVAIPGVVTLAHREQYPALTLWCLPFGVRNCEGTTSGSWSAMAQPGVFIPLYFPYAVATCLLLTVENMTREEKTAIPIAHDPAPQTAATSSFPPNPGLKS